MIRVGAYIPAARGENWYERTLMTVSEASGFTGETTHTAFTPYSNGSSIHCRLTVFTQPSTSLRTFWTSYDINKGRRVATHTLPNGQATRDVWRCLQSSAHCKCVSRHAALSVDWTGLYWKHDATNKFTGKSIHIQRYFQSYICSPVLIHSLKNQSIRASIQWYKWWLSLEAGYQSPATVKA